MSYLTDEELPPLPKLTEIHATGIALTYTAAQLRQAQDDAIEAYLRKHGEPVQMLREAWATLHDLSVDMAAGPLRKQMQNRARSIRVLLDQLEQSDGTYTIPQPTPQERQDATRLDWLQKAADARKVELAKSIMGTGYEIGEWPSMRVTVKSGSLRDVIDAAMSKEPGHE